MKETPLSNCERRFLLRAIEEKKVWFGPRRIARCVGLKVWTHTWPAWARGAIRGTTGTFTSSPGFIFFRQVLFKSLVTPAVVHAVVSTFLYGRGG